MLVSPQCSMGVPHQLIPHTAYNKFFLPSFHLSPVHLKSESANSCQPLI